MAKHNSLRLPWVNLFYRRLRLSALEEQRQPHAEEYLAVGMIHSGELGRRSPRLGNLVQFEVDDYVGEYQRARSFVEENELLEITSGKKQLVDFAAPFFGCDGVQVSREVDIHMPDLCSSAYTR